MSQFPMAQSTIEKELRLIRKRLDAIEEAIAEEMTDDDKAALKEALKEHREGRTIPFKSRSRKN